MIKNKKLIVANWKMNPTTLAEAKKLFEGIKKTASKVRNTQTVICPPSVYLSELKKFYFGHKIAFGAQDVFWEKDGPYTGEQSPEMIKDIGAKYVIIGHSERRERGETNEMVNKKVIASLKEGLNVILCIGEKVRDLQALYLKFLEEEIRSALLGAQKKNIHNLIIAYEPIWAIGKTADNAIFPHQMHEMYIFIKKIITGFYDKKLAFSVPILYGGSVESYNAELLLTQGEADGFLVGHNSLNSSKFGEILKIADNS
ncbi:triose-phosphate isomerase [Candidatus Campbellbacteria bacterium CG10_big_fil_rev_8_21_14_0_10_35_52]|uniref:Triosephosphate isomerase n=1 Tax=Candidatus Campbellbacteria bacterium CG10_big_fil_rev_8_21_14_0_10_35_52 TaxID=1974527 RepID=A0A2M6WVS0_9BACT|nr:MAG: triose-phosphate isomerase [Candidatus Campbellbacteria bacterium CG10_big_fil_rev_8_21_14_0_10_35_52]